MVESLQPKEQFLQLQALSLKEFAQLCTADIRRKITRGFTDQEKIFLENLKVAKKPVKTHCRDMVILPSTVGAIIRIYNGKEFVDLTVTEEMIGRRFGEFSLTRKRVRHGDAGVGATKGSGAVSVR